MDLDRKSALLELIEQLVRIPSVTESARESEPAFWIKERLSAIRYFRENPAYLRLIETSLEGAAEKLHALIVRVDAAVDTKRTVLLISHFDVVDTRVYGELAQYAFDPTELMRRLGSDGERDSVLYGRGVMDMKCGVALEIDILEEFVEHRGMFDVNIVVAFVGDEENSSAGMRGVLPLLAAMQGEGLEFLAAVNTEPGEAGQTGKSGPMVYLGTLGKLMPCFYARGRGAHMGNCYHGYSAALTIANLVATVEGNPALADPLHGTTPPSWICLDMGVLKDGYSVTIPDRAYAYFNCFTTTNTPLTVLEQMRQMARAALEKTTAHYRRSCDGLTAIGYDEEKFSAPEYRVLTLSELTEAARRSKGADFDQELERFIKSLPSGDLRARGLSVTDKIASMAGEEGPYIICSFLPPWLPMRTDFTGDERDSEVIEAAHRISHELREEYQMEMLEAELFAGLCDLSYVGGKVSGADLATLESNLPGFGQIYQIPLAEMSALGLPVVNLGPSGEDAHKKTEKLHLRYSLEILPYLLRSLIRQLSECVR